jgi:hypothetical protein
MDLQPGKLRLKSHALIGNLSASKLVHMQLCSIKGILDVKTSAITGFIIIRYNPDRTSGHAILNYLIEEKWIANVLPFPTRKLDANPHRTAEVVQKDIGVKARHQNINRLAMTAVKLVLPLIVARYMGKSASRFVSSFL